MIDTVPKYDTRRSEKEKRLLMTEAERVEVREKDISFFSLSMHRSATKRTAFRRGYTEEERLYQRRFAVMLPIGEELSRELFRC